MCIELYVPSQLLEDLATYITEKELENKRLEAQLAEAPSTSPTLPTLPTPKAHSSEDSPRLLLTRSPPTRPLQATLRGDAAEQRVAQERAARLAAEDTLYHKEREIAALEVELMQAENRSPVKGPGAAALSPTALSQSAVQNSNPIYREPSSPDMASVKASLSLPPHPLPRAKASSPAVLMRVAGARLERSSRRNSMR